ncbi:MAG: hypothetical protein Q4C95_08780 [Planctomycetia bacterium]|nr:hypothetical protein [Planctomycetia bacterium]
MNSLQNESSDTSEFTNSITIRKYNVSGKTTFANGTNSLCWHNTFPGKQALWQLMTPFEFRSSIVNSSTVYENTPSAMATLIYLQTATGANNVQFLSSDERNYKINGIDNRLTKIYAPSIFDASLRMKRVNQSISRLAKIIPFRTGDRVYAIWNQQSGNWELISNPIDFVRFQLTESLTHNHLQNWQSAPANIVYYDTSVNNFVVSDFEIIVVDYLNRTGSHAGDRGYAKRLADLTITGYWEIVEI